MGFFPIPNEEVLHKEVPLFRQLNHRRGHAKKVLAPSQRKEMALYKSSSVRLVCEAFSIRQTCYRYPAKLSSENTEIAHCLTRLTNNQRNWGFGLCFLYLRNMRNTLGGTTSAPIASIVVWSSICVSTLKAFSKGKARAPG